MTPLNTIPGWRGRQEGRIPARQVVDDHHGGGPVEGGGVRRDGGRALLPGRALLAPHPLAPHVRRGRRRGRQEAARQVAHAVSVIYLGHYSIILGP